MKIVYVAGLGHSGSTILDMSLGCSEKIVGLGEVSWILRATASDLSTHPQFTSSLCSCGATIPDCEIWKDTKTAFQENPDISIPERYEIIIDQIQRHYGDDVILLDSSKKPSDYLLYLNRLHDLKIIFLVRDVRSWAYSRFSRHGTNRLKLAIQWYRANKRLLTFLHSNKFDFVTMGYEEFAVYPEHMLKQLCEYLNVDFEKEMLSPDKTKSHVLNGNVAKGDPEKRARIIYDARWMTDINLWLMNPLTLPVMKFNQAHVYSNFMKGQTKAFGVKQRDFLFFGDREKEKLTDQGWGLK